MAQLTSLGVFVQSDGWHKFSWGIRCLNFSSLHRTTLLASYLKLALLPQLYLCICVVFGISNFHELIF